jgi:hypothetical protein
MKIQLTTPRAKRLRAQIKDYLRNFANGSGAALERNALKSEAGGHPMIQSFVHLHRQLRKQITT